MGRWSTTVFANAVLLAVGCGTATAVPAPLALNDAVSQFYVESDSDGLFDDAVGSSDQFSIATGGYGARIGYGIRAAMEFDVAPAPNFNAWKQVILTFQTSSHLGLPTLQMFGYQGDGAITPADLLVTDLLYQKQVAAAFNDVVDWEVDVTEFAKDFASRGNYLGFSFRAAGDITDSVEAWRGFFIFSPGPDCVGCAGVGPQLKIFIAPEPGSFALLGLGLAGMGMSRRRKADCTSAAIITTTPASHRGTCRVCSPGRTRRREMSRRPARL